MNWFYQLKHNFLIRLLNALGFGGVIGFCIVSCDSKPASQDIQNNSVEIQNNTEPATDTKSVEPQPTSDTTDVVNDPNSETEKPENSVTETAYLKPEESQPNSETDTETQENQDLQANTEANDSNQEPEETNDVQPVDEVEVVSKDTEGAIKISYTPQSAKLKYKNKVICKKSPCYIKINHASKRVSATISANGYITKKVVIDESRPNRNSYNLEPTPPKRPNPPRERHPVKLYLM